MVIPQDYRNSVSYRLGTEWDAKPWITLRSGLYYEASAIPDKSLGVSLMDGNKIGYGVGATYTPSSRPELRHALSKPSSAQTRFETAS